MTILEGWIKPGRPDGRPPLIGIAGCQASGKTTLSRIAVERFGVAHFSIDDVYLTKAERQTLAAEVHPLLAVRGPPGTHDLGLARATIEALSAVGPRAHTPIPAFDKLADDRLPLAQWPVFEGRPSAILVDGWCVGATAVTDATLAQPANALEAEEDPRAVWRRRWNADLAGPYRAWFDSFDAVLFLAAPSFDVVLDWRCQQEAGLLGVTVADLPPRRRAQLARFIAHYQRLTEHMLAGGVSADATVRLGPRREVLRIDL